MSTIFISYRRMDSQLACDRIHASLRATFGAQQVFRDINAIPGGVNFRGEIENALKHCAVMLVVIGPQWVNCRGAEGTRRLDNTLDLVRVEIETAFSRHIPILPLLVQNAEPPLAEDLPANIQALAYQNARPVRPDPDFDRDMQVVVQEIIPYVKLPHQNRALRMARNSVRRVVGFAISLITLLLFIGALASWVHIPYLSDFVRLWLGN